ncbi:Nramp family divalent metal transporter [Paeniglutamicibacter gangotriensis]|uniref:Mn(2+) uptake NRAMP transporter MntH n=1 Tax=Paeniglutamicibacter gangotriensis TaxID=254787 RepID=A0A5B0EBR4_9MICC|nr:Nramp family divalent metal transporter [Paeniglutamicibacter gangotriensis]KAA0976323.1 Mn(2+) uptake NRAMP transporter MntH [Paeniglutamicibacter gangotriensis]
MPPAQRLLWLLGPALVAGVAYLDPGNVAANMSAGAQYGYLLVWGVLSGNIMAWLVQYLSAKLGVVTGKSLPEVLRERFGSRTGRLAYWIQAEAVAMATDIAEVIGGAVALYLLFELPLLAGGLITGVISMGLLLVQSRRGPWVFERIVIGLLLVIAVGFCAGVVIAPPEAAGMASGLVPRFADTNSVLLAVSILGATIMPHAIYAHSSLARDRFGKIPNVLAIPRLLRATRWDVSLAMLIAGSVNVAMLLLAAVNLAGVQGTESLEGAHAALEVALGPVIATLFAVGLLASGLASTSVGAYAGAEIMAGLLHRNISLLARRLITLAPALAILAAGVDPTFALILSQVALSFGIPFALIPLVNLTARKSVMGPYANRWFTTAAGIIISVLLVSLNVLLIVLTIRG